MNSIEVVKVSTKTNATAPAVDTELTIDWEGMTREDERALARQSIVIKWQGKRRDKKGTKKNPEPVKGSVPKVDSIKAADYKVGTKVAKPKKSIQELFAELSPEQQREFLAQHMGQ